MDDIKYNVFVFNTFFTISGLSMLIAGAIVLSEISDFNQILEVRVTAPPIVLIVIGAVILLTASLGCYGTIRESLSMLKKFDYLLCLIFVIEIAVVIAAAVFKSDLRMMLQKSLQSSIERFSREDLIAWDNVQQKLQCCGVNGASDWRNHTLPPSCYYLYQAGCLRKLESKINWKAEVLIGVGIGLSFLPLFGIFFERWLASVIRKRNAEVELSNNFVTLNSSLMDDLYRLFI